MPLRTPRARTYAETVLADGPYAYWRMDERGIVFFDSGPGVRTAAAVGAPTAGKPGPLPNDPAASVLFAGSDSDYVQARAAFPAFAIGGYALEAWIRCTAIGGGGTYNNILGILNRPSNGPSFTISGATANVLSLFDGDLSPNETNGTRNLVDSKWHHVVATTDTTTLYLYVDGRLDNSQAVTMSAGAASATPVIGADPGATGHSFTGNIAQVAYYAKVLTATQVLDHYRAGTNPAFMGENARNLIAAAATTTQILYGYGPN